MCMNATMITTPIISTFAKFANGTVSSPCLFSWNNSFSTGKIFVSLILVTFTAVCRPTSSSNKMEGSGLLWTPAYILYFAVCEVHEIQLKTSVHNCATKMRLVWRQKIRAKVHSDYVQPLSFQRRIQLDIAFRCTRSNVELKSTPNFTVFYVGFPKLMSFNGCLWTWKIRDFPEN
jgi:hypothetical protein